MMRHILCFGNPLHGDDGFGPAVYQRLSALPLPSGLRLFDAGTAGLSALLLFRDCDEAIIVDSLAPAGMPGRLCQPLAETVISESSSAAHGIGIGFLLKALTALPEPMPRIRIIAVEAASVTPFRPRLSEPVFNAIDPAVAVLSDYFGAGEHE